MGLARQHTDAIPDLDAMLMRVQNDLFDLGADLATPDTGEKPEYEPLRIVAAQVERLEREIDRLNADLEPLRSFVLPAGSAASAALHVARTVARRAERQMVALASMEGEAVSTEAIAYSTAFRISCSSRPAGQMTRGAPTSFGPPATTDNVFLFRRVSSRDHMFIPLHDRNELKHIRMQYVTITLIVIDFVAWLAIGPVATEDFANAAILGLGYIPAIIFDYADLDPSLVIVPDEFTFVTYSFLHGDFMHLAMNMLFLWVFGDNVEDALGHFRFLVFYLLCAAAGALAHGLLDPASEAPLIGASGAISGVVAAYFLLHPKVRVWVLVLFRIPLPLPAAIRSPSGSASSFSCSWPIPAAAFPGARMSAGS